ncbi:MAG TPA: AAA family ATPase [Smithella sp.]|nr:AAA family ATPase [Smithella sp.]HOG91099.1 AAA family ATPase [Smithella sp.]HQH17733.1 AAA family ATPase [Smithella sp.]
MNYYSILNFKKEPFSNSPEPEFLFQLPQYSDCLQKLELAVRLRRGLNVVIGDIGTGKTTLCRKLIQNFSSASPDSTDIETHLLLDPAFNSTMEFLQTIALMLGIKDSDDDVKSEWSLKERIKDYLFQKGVHEKRIVVLIIDEGQKISEPCLEILREFLNYETNTFKLLQIIVFAQKEFQSTLHNKANLLDRVNVLYHLQPLSFNQMREMINYRLNVARNFENVSPVFSASGFLAVYLHTGGYPRKVVFLCHQVILKMIIRGRESAGWFLVRSCVNENEAPLFRKLTWALAGILVMIIGGLAVSSIALNRVGKGADQQTSVLQTKPAVVPVEQVSIIDHTSDALAGKTSDVHDLKMPDSIGKLSMTPRRTIWWTLYNIYGDNTSSEIINKFFAVNPHLKNKDYMTVGTMVTLPAIPAERKPVKTGDVIIALDSGQDLEKMYNIFRNHPDAQVLPALTFLAYWNKRKGFEFAVVIDKSFKDMNSAREAIHQLPSRIAGRVKMLSHWDEETVFFNRRALPN